MLFAISGICLCKSNLVSGEQAGRRTSIYRRKTKKARLRQARRLLIVPFKTKIFLYSNYINELVIPDADDSPLCLALGNQQHKPMKIR